MFMSPSMISYSVKNSASLFQQPESDLPRNSHEGKGRKLGVPLATPALLPVCLPTGLSVSFPLLIKTHSQEIKLLGIYNLR